MKRALNPDTPTGRRILDVATALFYERGIRAVGVDLIALEAETTKKTIYDRFGSKDGLVAAYLSRRGDLWHSFIGDWLATHPGEGPERVLTMIDAEQDWRAGGVRGCAYINAYAEIGNTDHPGAEVVRTGKAQARDLFIRLATEAGVAGPEAVGTACHLVYEGMLVSVSAGGRQAAYDEAREAMRALLR